ncbi:MAG TPA: class I SAM-dependent methyltransferase [Candidatus Hydrogenedentes bacterium]|nr:class I SAM-dependent methyltransferase [Candidatus Hydrogenedentota bacterium]
MMHPLLQEIVRGRAQCPVCATPEHLREEACEDGSARRCGACGLRMTLTADGLLAALPPHLAETARENAEYYDAMARRGGGNLSNRSHSRNHLQKCGTVLRHLGLGPGMPPKTVLEFGIGLGSHAAAVAETGAAYAGLDISPGLLEFVQRGRPELRDGLFAAADATALPFQEASFDAVFGVAVLHHLAEPLDGVRELLRVLKPGGRFCFLEPKRFYPVHFLGYLRNPKVEVGTMKTTRGRILGCLRAMRVAEAAVDPLIYTPNRPRALVPLYDRVDGLLAKAPLGGLLSVMFCVHGVK